VIAGNDTLNVRRTLKVGDRSYDYYSLKAAETAGLGDLSRLPFSLKVLLENLLPRAGAPAARSPIGRRGS
jgi:aconitate hydratase